MSNTMWGGRFQENPDDIMEKINVSIDYDCRLYKQDIIASKAHISMLEKQKIVNSFEANTIKQGLDSILIEIESNKFNYSRKLEDIHMNIESRLSEIIGPIAGKLHTARSRNDQVATDFKLWIKDTLKEINKKINNIIKNLAEKAKLYYADIMPGFTHLQSAQPITFGHHLLAYVEMFNRDQKRLQNAYNLMNECPLGAAALAGTSFPIDRNITAKLLNFDRPTANSIDSVSDRDFVIEALFVSSVISMHLSRLAEEIIIWSSAPFNFIKLSDKFSTGSSIMPQKKNPDAAELIRAKTGRIYGSLHSLLTIMKGLPLAYSKDMQEDKEQAFNSLDNISISLDAMNGMIKDMIPNTENMKKLAGSGYSTATDLADWLVRILHMPFRQAHHITGKIVNLAINKQVQLHNLSLKDMQSI